MKLFETITSQLCKMLVEVLLRGATPMGFPVRIAAPCSGPKIFSFSSFIQVYWNICSIRVWFWKISCIWPGKGYFVSSAVWEYRLASAALWLGCGCYWVVWEFSERWVLLPRSGLFREVSSRQDALRLSIDMIMRHPRSVISYLSRGTQPCVKSS